MVLSVSNRPLDYGLLTLRVGIGLMFVMIHGYPKIAGGAQTWTGLGKTFGNLVGISVFHTFWGFMAAMSEFAGGILLITGFLFRPACVLMLFTMLVALMMNIRSGYGFSGGAEAVEMGVVFLSLVLIGPGKFTLRNFVFPKQEFPKQK